jgi:hypothetical protein
MNKGDWLKLIEELVLSGKNAKSVATKYIVSVVLKLSGFQAWLAAKVVSKLIEFGWMKAKEVKETIQDKQTVKKGEELISLPPTEEVKQKRKDNFKDLIEGKK